MHAHTQTLVLPFIKPQFLFSLSFCLSLSLRYTHSVFLSVCHAHTNTHTHTQMPTDTHLSDITAFRKVTECTNKIMQEIIWRKKRVRGQASPPSLSLSLSLSPVLPHSHSLRSGSR